MGICFKTLISLNEIFRPAEHEYDKVQFSLWLEGLHGILREIHVTKYNSAFILYHPFLAYYEGRGDRRFHVDHRDRRVGHLQWSHFVAYDDHGARHGCDDLDLDDNVPIEMYYILLSILFWT